jgi:polysaccharide biosynthesis transport protein
MDPRPTSTAQRAHEGPERTGLGLTDLTGALRRRWILFLGLAGGVVALVMLVTLLLPKVYESEAALRVRPDQGGGMAGRLGSVMSELEDAIPLGMSLPGMGDSDVQSEIGVLRSRRIMEAVADSLALHVDLVRPWQRARSEVFHVLEGGADAPRGNYLLRRRSDGSYRIRSRLGGEEVALPDRVNIGEPFRVGPMLVVLDAELAQDPPRVIWFQVRRFRRTIRNLRRDIRIQRSEVGSRLIEIRYRHSDPELARALVNGMVERFLDYSETVNKSDSRREVEILSAEVARWADALAESEAQLQSFQEEERIIHPEEQAIMQVERIAEVTVARDAMRVEKEALEALLRTVRERTRVDGSETPYRQLATFPSFITNNAVQELLRNLSALENHRSDLLVRRTEENVDVEMVQSRIREVEGQLHDMATDYLESLTTQIAAADRTLERFGVEVETIPAVELEYTRLSRERRLNSEIYLFLESRLTEAQIQEAIDDARVRVVDLGVAEDRPVFPRLGISLALSMILGTLVGLFGVVAAEAASPVVRSGDEAEEHFGVPTLAVIPGHGGRPWDRRPERTVIARTDPWHPASEEFRGLALALDPGQEGRHTLLITAPESGVGPSVVAANLGVALAGQGRRVAVVEGHLRGGTLGSLLNVPGRPGWVARTLAGEPPEPAGGMESDARSRGSLDVFVAGEVTAHPLTVLGSDEARSFIARLRDSYDVVILDSPGLEAGHDALVLAPLADATLVVVRSGHTPTEAVRRVLSRIERADGRVEGLVLTDPGRGLLRSARG